MCGICVCFGDNQNEIEEFHKKHIQHLLERRGPDHSKIITKEFNGKCLLFHATVLHQQGIEMCRQPVENDTNSILLFNGDLYMKIENGKSDTEHLFELIEESENEQNLLEMLTNLVGPFSIIIRKNSKIYFARDALGRNSLLIGVKNGIFFLSSVVDECDEDMKVIELPPLGIFSMDLDSPDFIELFPYQNVDDHPHYQQQFELLQTIIPVKLQQSLQKSNLCSEMFNYDFAEICKNHKEFDEILENQEVRKCVEKFLNLLKNSVRERIERTQEACKKCKKLAENSCQHAKIGILFSGGVDCSLIAFLTHKILPENQSIDLMNVSFEKVSNKSDKIDWNVPDRVTGLETLDELQKISPTRNWNFIRINITRNELNENLKRLSSLVYPLSNVLDESLGAALYFASRGIGEIHQNEIFESQCRVILIGSGADELFGGYTRHRNAFRRSSPDHDLLTEELTLDWVRLPSRNLARDDRVIGDNGITVRAPFIEENFVNFTRSLTSTQRCYPELPEGVGDKLLLRLAAYHLGLKNCCTFKKRALQFGSRIADKRQKATDISKAFYRDKK